MDLGGGYQRPQRKNQTMNKKEEKKKTTKWGEEDLTLCPRCEFQHGKKKYRKDYFCSCMCHVVPKEIWEGE